MVITTNENNKSHLCRNHKGNEPAFKNWRLFLILVLFSLFLVYFLLLDGKVYKLSAQKSFLVQYRKEITENCISELASKRTEKFEQRNYINYTRNTKLDHCMSGFFTIRQ